MESPPVRQILSRAAVVIAIEIVIALVHVFRLGQVFDGPLYRLYYGYAGDVLLPFGFYFLLSINEHSVRWLRRWTVKAGIVFLGAAAAETGQYFGIYALGVTFDPLDLVAYAGGALSAAAVDVLLFRRIFPFWTIADR